MDDGTARTADQLVELGFSQYEARAYIGLLGQEPLTGYALANLTGIPQPKVYETLRRLAEKRAVVQIGSDPARFVAVPAEYLLSQLDTDFRRRLAEVKVGLAELGRGSGGEELRVLRSPRSWAAIARHAGALLDAAERHVYLSAHADQLDELAPAVRRADEREVRLDVLCFGRVDLELTHGRLLRHASTDGMVYRHHQARQVALVADGQHTLWALAADGTQWDAVVAADPLLAAAVKGYVRHDLYLQEIYADFPEQLEAAYGPGLDKLVTPYAEAGESRAADRAPAKKTRTRRTRSA
ncbi:TrmB family transcriptional regulator [Streptomyces sp. NPDC057257]|uniref:TrmB family transcriptional regulator n=1 Tax=Streptomyces sp. NPDC057257 TaxID=3346071 RepID=UPI00363507C8